ncbi:MAG: septal ring lytic transglycosylase RlpA family protein [Candidatus Omnitrophota bacterium]
MALLYILKKRTFFIWFGIILTAFNSFANELLMTPAPHVFEGTASWYAEFSPGIKRTTANMETFRHDKLTCAMWGVPFNTILEVTNAANGKKVFVRVNDRGPAKRLARKGRVIDLTFRAFREIESPEKGLTKVRVRICDIKYPRLKY